MGVRCFMAPSWGRGSGLADGGLRPPAVRRGGRMLRIRGYRLKCGFPSSRGLAVSRQADGLVPPLTWRRAGVLPAWTPRGRGAVRGEGVCHARWPSGLHVQDKGPAPGRGRGARGGAGRRLRPYFGGPPAFLLGDRDVNLRVGPIWGPPRSKESLGRGSVSRPSIIPFFGEAICLGIGPAFVHFWVRIGGRRRIGVSSPPHFLSPDSNPSRVFGNWGGMGHAPVTSVWVVVEPLA